MIKKSFIFVISFFLILTLIFLGVFYFYGKSIKSNMEESQNEIAKQWDSIYTLSSISKKSMKKNFSPKSSTTILKDSLFFFLSTDADSQTIFQKECSLPYLYNEYNINRLYLKIIKSDSLFRSDSIVKNITLRNTRINRLIDDYNHNVMMYNEYITIIPNQLVAKRNNFKRKVLYSIKYGEENKNPIEESKKLPKWAENVDTTSLYKN